MRYIDQWLSGLGLDHVIPLLQAHGITTPKKLALLSLRDIYEVVGVEDSEDRKKLYFLIQRLQSILKKEKGDSGNNDQEDTNEESEGGNDSGRPSPTGKRHFSKSPPRSPPRSPHKMTSKSTPPQSPSTRNATEGSRESVQYPRASFVDVSPLRQPNRRSKDNVPRKSVTHESNSEDETSLQSDSTDSMKSHPTNAAAVRDDLKLLRRQHRQSTSRDSGSPVLLSTDREHNHNMSGHDNSIGNGINVESNTNMRHASPIVPPKALPVKLKVSSVSTSQAGTVAQHTAHRTKRTTPSLSVPSPPPSPPPTPPLMTSRDFKNRSRSRSRSPPPRTHNKKLPDSSHHSHSHHALKPHHHKVSSENVVPKTRQNNFEDNTFQESDMAIRVVVRKRPISRSEQGKNEIDVLEVFPRGKVLVHEPKTKVDLTKIIETQEFIFDDAFDYYSSNEEIYVTVMRSLVATMFQGGKGSCFAYGQTGSGKTFTMMGSNPAAPAEAKENAGLYVLAARDIFKLLDDRQSQCQLMVSCFEIYGGKLFDLLNQRNPVKCLEDSKQRVQLPGLSEHCVVNVQELLNMMSQAHGQRSTGSTGANLESSRSHQVLQLQLVEERTLKSGKIVKKPCGKLSFIDLAGSERGADTSNNSKQTRMEGAEINTSLLALKEVIRSLEKKHGHTPFRGSKLTQVLKDSFIGENTKTCMVACVSPSMSNCEHTLNTLRYADRVKEHQQRNDTNDKAVRPSSAMPSSNVESTSQGIHRLNLDTNMLLQNNDKHARPSTSAGIHHRDEFDMDDLNINIKNPKKRNSMLQAPKESSRQQNSRLSLQQQPAKISGTAARVDAISSNRLSANRMSLNGPPPPPDMPEDMLDHDETPSMASGIRLRKGSAGNAIKIRKGQNNSVPLSSGGRQVGSKIPTSPRATSKHVAPPPPPPSSPPDSYKILGTPSTNNSQKGDKDGEKRNSLASPILLEHVPDKQRNALVYEDRATEALLSLSALASIPISPSSEKQQNLENSYHSEEDSVSSDDSSSSDDKIVLHHANRKSLSPPRRSSATDNSSIGGSRFLGKTLNLVTAHKHAIAEMVEVMKQEMELVQNMEATDDRDSEAYALELENVLKVKKNSVNVLRAELQRFQNFRSKQLEQERMA